MAEVVNLAAIRKARAPKVRKRRRKRERAGEREQVDHIVREAKGLTFITWQLAMRTGSEEGVEIAAAARAAVVDITSGAGATMWFPDAASLIDYADDAITLLMRWRFALRTAITESEDDDPEGAA